MLINSRGEARSPADSGVDYFLFGIRRFCCLKISVLRRLHRHRYLRRRHRRRHRPHPLSPPSAHPPAVMAAAARQLTGWSAHAGAVTAAAGFCGGRGRDNGGNDDGAAAATVAAACVRACYQQTRCSLYHGSGAPHAYQINFPIHSVRLSCVHSYFPRSIMIVFGAKRFARCIFSMYT